MSLKAFIASRMPQQTVKVDVPPQETNEVPVMERCSFCDRKAVEQGYIAKGKQITLVKWCPMDLKEWEAALEEILSTRKRAFAYPPQ